MYCENDTITVCVLFTDVDVNRSYHTYEIVYVNVDGDLLTNVNVPGEAWVMVRPEDDAPTDTPFGTTMPVGDRVKAVRIPNAAFPDLGITHVMLARRSCCDNMVANEADDIAYVIGLPPNVYEMVYPVGEYPVTVPTTVAGDNVSPSR